MLHFLRLARNFIVNYDPPGHQQGKNLKDHFVSRQTFNHLMISVQSALLKVKLVRKYDSELWF